MTWFKKEISEVYKKANIYAIMSYRLQKKFHYKRDNIFVLKIVSVSYFSLS